MKSFAGRRYMTAKRAAPFGMSERGYYLHRTQRVDIKFWGELDPWSRRKTAYYLAKWRCGNQSNRPLLFNNGPTPQDALCGGCFEETA